MSTLRLDPVELSLVRKAKVHGDAVVSLSPSGYDVPRSVSVLRDPSGNLLITFDYVDQEKPDKRQVDDASVILVGEHSGKVLGFVMRDAPEDITQRIVTSVDWQLARASKDNQRLNYQLIRNVVLTKLGSLLTPK